MEPTYVIIIVLVVAVVVLVLRLASRPGSRAGGDLQALRDSVTQLEDRVRDQLSLCRSGTSTRSPMSYSR